MDAPATRHSILDAVRSGDAEVRRGGYDAVVAVYWKPVYKYLRLKFGAAADEAQDTTQEFFTRAFEKGFFDGYDSSKARFRTFLRVCLDRFVANQRKAASRLKRGGAHAVVPLDFETAEGELRRHDVAVPPDLDDYFHREWVRSLFALAVADLQREYAAAGRQTQFRVFELYDLEAPGSAAAVTYGDVAAAVGVSTSDVTNYLFAARRAFRRVLLARLRSVCGDGADFEAEARHLLRSAGPER
jgi:DNA-directed RNA polymerase specialized sigma24 family protein